MNPLLCQLSYAAISRARYQLYVFWQDAFAREAGPANDYGVDYRS